ncbi:hypothetical protein D9599_19240 [Roseomonas sp. KE2513]|uniref:hypothetical protein n=1 Tax=Roseomonas sp. KE2513 TaxID=2479202 RepID=UPI0018DEFD36|nr:hypothetical protein [Roseomonas sp. KE2513]MBI0537699.1 hypothetical protein [Roseomonas sp. KE2513]
MKEATSGPLLFGPPAEGKPTTVIVPTLMADDTIIPVAGKTAEKRAVPLAEPVLLDMPARLSTERIDQDWAPGVLRAGALS